MSTASSASDRIERAQAALAEYDRVAASGLGTGYALDTLARALREMISPAAVEELPEQAADKWHANLIAKGMVEIYGQDIVFAAVGDRSPYIMHRAAYLAGVQRGIVMGWNSWEPETAPGLPSGSVEQLIANGKAALDRVEASGESDRMDDVFDARDEAARWIAQVIELLEGQS